jgi:rod shape-determining protein MreC
MQRLLKFFHTYRAFFIFVILESIAMVLLVRNNRYQGALYFNTSNSIVGQTLTWSNDLHEYFRLRIVNDKLAAENARLRFLLSQKEIRNDFSTDKNTSKAVVEKFAFKVAKVINCSVNKENNYVTINKGTEDGLHQGMGVIAPDGIVGKIKYCSPHFSTVTSILHSTMLVSAKIGRSDVVGTVKWDGINPEKALLSFIPRHNKIKKGDKVVTSGFNAIYPEGIMIGTVNKFSLKPDESFYYIEIKLSTDFRKLAYVYIVENKLKPEIDTLTVKSGIPLNE